MKPAENKVVRDLWSWSLWYVFVVVVFLLFMPVKSGKVNTHPEHIDINKIIPQTDSEEIELVGNIINELREENILLTKNLYPKSLGFKWSGPYFSGSGSLEANRISKRFFDVSGKSVRIIFDIEGVKYSGYYEP